MMNTKTRSLMDKTAQPTPGACMKKTLLSAAMVTAIGLAGPAGAAPRNSIIFDMVPSAGARNCLSPKARARVSVSNASGGQNLHVETFNLPENTPVALFILQVPNNPFGLSWYQGDMDTDERGRAVGDFTGIFSVETFSLAPGVAPAPVVFPDNAAENPITAPIQMYHLGIWFGDPNDGDKAGCPGVTPFDGDHEAGIQILNTNNFQDGHGPLRDLEP